MSDNFRGAGVLRFLTPRRALVLDLSGSTTRESATGWSTATDVDFVQLRLGHRWYRPIHDRIVQHVTVGASFARSVVEHTVTTVEGLEGKTAQQANSGGAYADLGAAWLVTPHLSLGAAWTADVSYKRASTDASGEGVQLLDQRVRSWNANAGSVSLRLNFYF